MSNFVRGVRAPLFVFDRSGRTASIFYGAPADLHEKAEKLIESLLR